MSERYDKDIELMLIRLSHQTVGSSEELKDYVYGLKDENARLREENERLKPEVDTPEWDLQEWERQYNHVCEELARLREAQRWIPAGESLPEEREIVSWYHKRWKRTKEGYITKANTLHVWGGFYSLETPGLYWRRSPEPPEVK